MKEFKRNHRTLIVISTILLIVVACAKVYCCVCKKCKCKSEDKLDEE